ncbi:hypothetical protein [Alteromonas sp. KUL49]|uniref:hypothetical protein n=1 Tax=Alteromonas sp. KUL49 TaxID=2480798 RepID=UPI00102F20D8|nr:hypothetical protein [Alteromonas sp. KUL49]TAP42329.1 hypothetical protein EYS00_01550 [Alteromonas sp. KUL49]GEA09937.1 hypothetical protein KUL49_03120 [Alteromonas sp. KUL49]
MKTLIATFALGLASMSANAIEFVNSDGSALSQICIAAVESDKVLDAVSGQEMKRIACNDMSLEDFIATYRATETVEPQKAVAFENANSTVEARLCIAAATSNEAYTQELSRIGRSINTATVACNGESLVDFAKSFNKTFNG